MRGFRASRIEGADQPTLKTKYVSVSQTRLGTFIRGKYKRTKHQLHALWEKKGHEENSATKTTYPFWNLGTATLT